MLDDIQVKAHVTICDDLGEDSRWKALGNNAADQLAVESKSQYSLAPPEFEEYSRHCAHVTKVAAAIARVGACWTTLNVLKGM